MPFVQPPDPASLPGRRLRTYATKLHQWIESIKPVSGAGITVSESLNGSAISAKPSSGVAGAIAAANLTVADEATDTVEKVEYITFAIASADDTGVKVVDIDGDGDAVVTFGVSQQITGAVNGVPVTAYVLFDPTANGGQWTAL